MPDILGVVDTLNDAMTGADSLEQTIEARFTVLDAQLISDQITNRAATLRIDVDCERVFNDSCTPEGTFVVLMRAFRLHDKIIAKISNDLPVTVQMLQMVAFDRMSKKEMLGASWSDVVNYTLGRINGNQLGSGSVRPAIPP